MFGYFVRLNLQFLDIVYIVAFLYIQGQYFTITQTKCAESTLFFSYKKVSHAFSTRFSEKILAKSSTETFLNLWVLFCYFDGEERKNIQENTTTVNTLFYMRKSSVRK